MNQNDLFRLGRDYRSLVDILTTEIVFFGSPNKPDELKQQHLASQNLSETVSRFMANTEQFPDVGAVQEAKGWVQARYAEYETVVAPYVLKPG